MKTNPPRLQDIEDGAALHTLGGLGYRLGYVATDWLVDRSSETAVLDFFRTLAGYRSWQEAFESAFGIATAAFYEQFEAYRAEVAPPLPHLIDSSDEPILVLLGEIPPETEATVRTRFAAIQELFGERLAAGNADYTVYVGADAESLADVHRLTTGNEVPEGFCSTVGTGIYVIATVDCVESSPRVLQRQHSHSIRARLAPFGSLPPVEQGHDRRGPLWLLLAIEAYADHAHETAIGPQTLDEVRADQIALAKRAVEPLSTLATWDEVLAAGFWRIRGLSSIAGELLADRASEAALFDYFPQLPTSDTWEAAFESAFGIATAAFYEQFEAYRAEVAPPLPHLTDDSDEPVLVLVGEMPPETEAAIRSTFAGIQQLFGERLEAGSADYTVYIGADAESLADVHRLTTGNEVPEGFCSTVGTGIYVIATVDCVESSPRVLQRQHSHSIRARPAPFGSLPPVEQGHDRRGPLWLLLAIEAYADHAHETAIGPQTLDEVRADQIALAKRAVEPLSTLATWDEVLAAGFWRIRGLSSIAGELLADRASEAALFDYFRQLPTSGAWEAAFEAAFGMTVDDFYGEFESYRLEVARPYVVHRISGVVLDPDANPVTGTSVGASRGEGHWEDTATTDEDGAFELAVRDGSNYLHVDLSTTGCSVPSDGWYADGIERVVDGADVSGVEIRLPEGSSCGQD